MKNKFYVLVAIYKKFTSSTLTECKYLYRIKIIEAEILVYERILIGGA